MTPVSWRGLLGLYLPLMFSGLLMTLEAPLITAGIARQSSSELFLAAFGVAFAIALIYEAPVIMVLEASIALGDGWPAYLRLRRAYAVLGTGLTLLGLVLFFTPVYQLLTESLMAIPRPIADAARPALMVLTFWPLPVGWRRLHQGVLIRQGRPGIISIATAVRLGVLGAILFGGVLRSVRGALLGAAAMVAGVVVEAAVVTVPALRALGPRRPGPPAPPSWHALWTYYRPLAATTFLQQANRPLITAGIAAARQAALSLAAWPVLLSVTMFTFGPIGALQQVVIAVPDHVESRRRTGRFVLAVGGLLTVTLLAITLTPLLDGILTGWFAVSEAVQDLVTPAARVLAVMPMVLALQALLRGRLIRDGRTPVVQRAMLSNLAVVAAWVGIGMTLRPLPGILLGALALLSGAAAETLSLWWGLRGSMKPALTLAPASGAGNET